MFCHFCKCEFADRAISVHLKTKHGLGLQDYYDNYVKTTLEGHCENCGCKTKFLGTQGYQRFCSVQCASKSPTVKEKRKLCNLEHYGASAPAASEIVKEKCKRTCLAKYGVNCVFQNTTVKTKIKQTKTDCDWAVISAKCKETKQQNYGDAHYNNREKAENTKLEKYGDEHYVNPAKAKETRLSKYGVDHHLKLDEYKEKMKQTCLEKYGVEHVLQNHEIFCKTKQKHEYDGLKFDSMPEIELYKKLKETGVDFEYQPNVCFEYEHDGKTHKYFPDFRIGNEYVELKGAHFFENGKMINPYDRSMDALFEAKHQCMIANNMKIIVV